MVSSITSSFIPTPVGPISVARLPAQAKGHHRNSFGFTALVVDDDDASIDSNVSWGSKYGDWEKIGNYSSHPPLLI